MPKAVREIKSFNLGVVTSADDNDIKADAAVYSKDIDPNSSEGRLKGRWKDTLIDLPFYKDKPVFSNPSSANIITREINISNSTVENREIYDDVPSYPIKINLVGTAPTSTVTVRVKILDFAYEGTYLKVSHDGTNYNNEGEYDELTFTTANYGTLQTIYLKPQTFALIDRVIKVQISAQSSEAVWNSSSLDSRRPYIFKGTVADSPGIRIKESTYKLHGVLEGLQGQYKLELSLTHSPELDTDTASVSITFSSNDHDRLYAHWAGGGATKETNKTFLFTNLNWSTYQTLNPYIEDDGIKQGNLQFSMNISGTHGSSDLYSWLDGGIEGKVRYDTGTFNDNDFNNGGAVNPLNVSSLENSDGEGGDGSGGNDGEKNWKEP